MPTAPERIYDAAAAALVEQQATAARMTGIMVPVGAAATAGALLLKPALDGVAHAGGVQIAGVVAGVIGIAVVLLVGLIVLIGPTIEGVEPRLLLEVAERPEVVGGMQDFETEAAIVLAQVRRENKSDLDRLRIVLGVVFAGLVLELLGLGVAALVESRSKPSPTRSAGLRVTTAHLDTAGMAIAGQIVPGAKGRVLLSLDMLGRTGQLTTTSAVVHRGRFHVRLTAPRSLVPLRSATYLITWPGSRSVQGEHVDGSLARCPEDCK